MNRSKINDPRFWKKWKDSGAVGNITDAWNRSYGLLLSEVQNYNLDNFSRCIVSYDGFVGKGRSWEYEAGGNSFEFEITPQQANLLSRLQDEFGGWELSLEEQDVMQGIPSNLVGKWRNNTHVTGTSQVATYKFLK